MSWLSTKLDQALTTAQEHADAYVAQRERIDRSERRKVATNSAIAERQRRGQSTR